MRVHVNVDYYSGVRFPEDAARTAKTGVKPPHRPMPARAYVLFAAVFLIVAAAGGAFFYFAHADTIRVNPSACLGGWENPQNAEGIPETFQGAGFSADNSAVLGKGVGAQIFCSGFDPGEGKIDGVPTAITLRIALAPLPPAPSSDAGIVEGAATSTPDAADATTTDAADASPAGSDSSGASTAVPDDTPDTPSAAPDVSPADSTSAPDAPSQPESAPLQDPGPQSFLDFLIPSAYAETTDATDTAPDASASDTPASAPLDSFDPAPAAAEDAAATATDTATSAEASPAVAVSEQFLEISISFDGTTWQTLGTLSSDELSSARFPMPVPKGFTWADLARVQVAVKTLPYTADEPAVALDGMELSVQYSPTNDPDAEKIGEVPVLPGDGGHADKDSYVRGEYAEISGAPAAKMFQIYWLDDPDTAPDASNVYGAQIGDDGTLEVDTSTLPAGRIVMVATSDSDGCGGSTLDECRLSTGYLGEVPFTVTEDTVQ